jgi:GAF domain-containing protein/DNA-binding CsgD family transcriptional regulator
VNPKDTKDPAAILSRSEGAGRRREQAVLRLGLLALTTTSAEEFLDGATGLVAEALSVEYCWTLELAPEGGLKLRAGVGGIEDAVVPTRSANGVPTEAGFSLTADEPIAFDDLRSEVRFEGSALLYRARIRSGITAAIEAGGEPFGVLGAYARETRSFGEAELRFIGEVARLFGAALTLRDGGRGSDTGKDEDRLLLLLEACEVLSATPNHRTAASAAVRLVVPALADLCFLDLVDESGDGVERLLRHAVPRGGEAVGELRHDYPLPVVLRHGTAKVLRTGRPELASEPLDRVIGAVARNDDQFELLRRLRPISYLCVPLKVRRKVFGALGFFSAGRRYEPEDLSLAQGLANCTALALENSWLHLPEAELVRGILRPAGREHSPARTPIPKRGVPELTRRQMEVLRMLIEGKLAREIARELYVSEATVRNHIRAIKQAFGARSQLEVVAKARRAGMIPE